ncbi:MAG: MMPL family transporter [Microthrixaceae bacterium]|jgi:RND superfamily putative drug exporter|nr:MMPL family transporter [Microthrixaceae bacterium]
MHQETATDRSSLFRLGRWCYRRHRRVLVGWVGMIIIFGAATASVGTGYSSSFGDFQSEATRGFDLVEKGFGGESAGERGTIVFVAEGGLDDPAARAAITEMVEAADAIEGLEVTSPFDNPTQVVADGPLAGKLGYADVQFASTITDFADMQAIGKKVRLLVPAAEKAGLRVELGGQVFGEFEPPESEVLGLGFAIVILILAFGSVLAMGLPIGMAVAGIASGVMVVGLVSNVMTMPDFTSTIAVMLGLGVGIDYALFIVTRFREDLHRGMPGEEAAGHAIDTAGRAVIFAGITVIISVLGMIVMGLGFIRGLGVGSAIAVAFTLAASITLLPALLGFAGSKLEVTRRRGLVAAGLVAVALVGLGLGFPAAAGALGLAVLVLVVGTFIPALHQPLEPRPPRDPRTTFWYRFAGFVQRRPWPIAIGGLALLAFLAIPVLSLRLGFSDEGNYPEHTTTRQAYDLLAEGFGPGFNGPLLLVSEVPDGTDPKALEAVSRAVAATDGIAFVSPAMTSQDGTVARWFAIPETAPQDAATYSLVRELRDTVLEDATKGTGLDVLVSSGTAIGVDFSEYLAERYPIFFGVILGLSFILLMAVFRSILVPLKAVFVNLLSIGAAYGVAVAVFSWGWGGSLIGVSGGGPIEPFIPMMLFAIVFGLSMDYEVFLLSRIKEEYDRTGDNASAVGDGLALTARVITAAALIMVVVFGSFLLETDRVVKLMGLGLATAVLLDATVVRMLLVPATMELLGDRNWWLPRWLDRILPVIHVEAPPDHVDVANRTTDLG